MMGNVNLTKAVIEKHIQAMLAEISCEDEPIGWIGDNASTHLTEVVFNTLAYSADVERYLEKEGMLKD